MRFYEYSCLIAYMFNNFKRPLKLMSKVAAAITFIGVFVLIFVIYSSVTHTLFLKESEDLSFDEWKQQH